MRDLCGSPAWRLVWIVVLVLRFSPPVAAQQFKYEKLHQFTSSDTVLAGPLVLGDDGYLYGTTTGGLGTNKGSIFRVDESGNYQHLHSFQEGEGSYPCGPLVPAEDGSLYGVTRYGGPGGYDSGVIFRYDADRSMTVLHRFDASEGRGMFRLIAGPDGAFYGYAYYGGPKGGGTVFRITRDGTFSILYSFSQEIICDTKRSPNSPSSLIVGSDGALYGTTVQGGPINFDGLFQFSYGVIFRLTLNGEFSVLHEFTKTGPGNPNSLVEGPDGSFYGTSGATSDSSGNVFRFTAPDDLRVLHTFQSPASGGPVKPDGYYPFGLILGKDGNLYGATSYGGTTFYGGTVFRISTDGVFQTLHAFTERVSGMPTGGLLQDEDGSLYGLTSDGGRNGSLYRILTSEMPGNRPPTVQPLTYTHPAGQPALSIHLLFKASDPDGNLLTAAIASQPQHGQASIEGLYVVYRPADSNAVRDDSFTFTVSDGRGGIATAPVFINVGFDPNNRAPLAPELFVLLQPGGTTRFSGLQGAIDPDGDALKVVAVAGARYGLAEVDTDGIVTYTTSLPSREDSFTITISDGQGHSIIRQVTMRPPLAGSFEGLLQTDTAATQTIGQIRLHLQESQTFSASLQLQSARYAFIGSLGVDGRYQTIIHSPTGSFELTLQPITDSGNSRIDVTLESESARYTGTAEPRHFTAADALAGRYTMLLSGPAGMQGTGYAIIQVRENGRIRLTGKTSDGTAFSAGTELQEGKQFELFTHLGSADRNRGSLSGTLSFRKRPGVSDGHGKLVWFRAKHARGRDRTFAQGALLSRYVPSLGIPGKAGEASGTVRLRGGGLPGGANAGVLLSWTGFYNVTSELSVQGIFLPATGLFRGTFTHPTHSFAGSFSGVIFQAQGRGAGVFSSPAGRGALELYLR